MNKYFNIAITEIIIIIISFMMLFITQIPEVNKISTIGEIIQKEEIPIIIETVNEQDFIINQLEFEKNKLIVNGEDGYFIVEINDRENLMFTFEAEEEGIIKLYYQNEEGEYSETYTEAFPIKKGYNKIFLVNTMANNIRIDLEMPSGIVFNDPHIKEFVYEYKLNSNIAIFLMIWVLFLNYIAFLFTIKKEEYNNKMNELTKYLMKNKYLILSCSVIALFAFAFEITHYTPSIDEKFANIDSIQNSLIWIYDGRFTIAIFKVLFMLFDNFPPIATTLISVIFLVISGFLWNIVLNKIFHNKNKIIDFIFISLYMTTPIVVTEYLCFNTFSIEVSLALIITSLASKFIISYFDMKEKKYLLISAILMFFSLGVYQNLVCAYIMIIVIYFWKKIYDGENIATYIKLIIISVLQTLFVLIVYTISYKSLIQLMPYRETLYIDGFSSHFDYSFVETMQRSYSNIFQQLLNNMKTGSYFYIISILLFCVIVFVSVFGIKKISNKIMYITLSVIIIISPYLLWLVMRPIGGLPIRSMHPIMIFTGFAWYFLLWFLASQIKYNYTYKIIIFTSIAVLLLQAQMVNSLFFYDNVRYKIDVRVTDEVVAKAKKISDNNVSVIYCINTYTNIETVNLQGEVMGRSMWNWYNEVRKANGIIPSEGYNVTMVDFLSVFPDEFDEYIQKLEIWPSENSMIITKDGRIIVRLS